MPELRASWSTQQLTEFLALVSSFADEAAAIRGAIERAAEALDADVGAVVIRDELAASVGFSAGEVLLEDLRAAAHGETSTLVVPGVGACSVLTAPLEEDAWLIVGRVGDEPYAIEDAALLRGMARVVSMTCDMLRSLTEERALRSRADRQAAENARLLASLDERQTLLERLSRIQRSIVHRAALPDVLDAIVVGARELLGDDVSAVRLVNAEDSAVMDLVASSGVPPDLVEANRHTPIGIGAGGRAIAEGRLVSIEEYERSPQALPHFAADHLQAAMAAPVHQNGAVAGSLLVASYRPGRTYSALEQEVLTAFAEHTSLALTDAKNFDDALHRAFHDALTELPNRPLFLDRLGHSLARTGRSHGQVAVLFLDLDSFKRVNDSFGHAAGDDLLRAVAERLTGCLRPADTVARFGGDEFAVLAEDVEDDEAVAVAQRILSALEAPFCVQGRELFITASIGVAVGREGVEDLMRNADLAMYKAKASGKGHFELFEPTLHAAVVERLELEVGLRRAVEQGEFVLHYQPIVELGNGRIVALEALVRWLHPTEGLVAPDRFIPVAEETRLIVPLGRWVMREACRQAVQWRAFGHDGGPLGITVNLSAQQLDHPSLLEDVRAALADSGLEPELLTFEITETLLMADTEGTIARLAELKELGIHLAVDDFGTGYSSLQYLTRFPIDVLKIAKSFVDGLAGGDEDVALVSAITDLAANFSLDVVAEGIETVDQQAKLLALGCGLGQGFYFSRPLDARAMEGLLSHGQSRGLEIPRAQAVPGAPVARAGQL
jgi:diguanylate cyclase (GGDEF)-like protein